MAVVNLIGVHGPILLRKDESGWWSKDGHWGDSFGDKRRNESAYHAFISYERAEVLLFLRGARAVAKRIKDTL